MTTQGGMSRVEMSCPNRSPDSLYWPRYPNGDKPGGLSGVAGVSLAISAGLTTHPGVPNIAGGASVITGASGALKGGVSSIIVWKPGQRMMPSSSSSFNGVNDAITQMDYCVARDPGNKILGFEFVFTMGQLESQAGGDYSGNWDSNGNQGITAVRTLIDHAKSYNPPRDISLFVNTSGNVFGNAVVTKWPDYFAPSYLASSTYGPQTSITHGGVCYSSTGACQLIVRYWSMPVALRITALLQAYVTACPELYKFDPILEMSVQNPVASQDYNGVDFAQNIAGPWTKSMRQAAPNLIILLRPTWLTNTSLYQQYFFPAVLPNKISIGDFDSTGQVGQYISAPWGSQTFRGVLNTGPVDQWGHQQMVPQPGWIDHRQVAGDGNDFHCFSNPDEFGKRPSYNDPVPPAKVGSGLLADIDSCVVLQQASHKSWMANAYAGPNCNRTVFSTSAPANPTPPGGGVVSHPNLFDHIQATDVFTKAYPRAWT